MFVIPALANLPHFPYLQLLDALRIPGERNAFDLSVPSTTWLLFSVLSLANKHFGKFYICLHISIGCLFMNYFSDGCVFSEITFVYISSY